MAKSIKNVIVHRGFESLSRGRFDDGGSNLYVNAKGVIERIHRTDVNNDGYVDIVMCNHHGYLERGPTWIYRPPLKARSGGKNWHQRQLPNDSGWMSRVVDVDGDGHLDLIVVNGENGVTSQLESYVYWGGPNGLTSDAAKFNTVGAYDVAAVDLTGNGLLDLIFPSAWVDHHNTGRPMPIHVHTQAAPRQFEDATQRYGLIGIAATSLACADLTGNGKVDLVVANYRDGFEYDTDSFVYWAAEDGFDAASPLRLPTHYALQALTGDLNGDGFDEIIFAGGDEVRIYWNQRGTFRPDHCTILEIKGFSTMFCVGALRAAVADVDGDGSNELVVAGAAGVQVRDGRDPQRVRTELPLPCSTWVAIADLDGDGRPEIITSRYDNRVTYETESAIFWNSPDGFAADRVSLLPTAGAMGCTAGDLDGDGQPVVIFNNTMQGPSQHWDDLPAYVYLGNRDSDYSPGHRLELPTGGAYSYIMADVDLDGCADLVFATRWGLRLFPGSSMGPKPDRFIDLRTACDQIMDVHVADFNRDGYLDLMAVGYTYNDKPETMAASTTIFWGSSEGFSSERSESFPTYCFGLAKLADVNQDGYLDIIVCEGHGNVLIYLGGPDGYSPDRVWRIALPAPRGGFLNVADLNGNGYLDIIVGMLGHYTRRPDTLCIFYGGPDGYSPDNAQYLSAGFSAHTLAVGDMNNDGHLDLFLPAYSTHLTRELPAYICWGDGKRIELEDRTVIPASCPSAAMMIDLTRNGYLDLVVACHRDDLGHQVDSLIYFNGPEGLSLEPAARLPGMGPHQFSTRDHGNAYTREPRESYISPPLELNERRPQRLYWQAETPATTTLEFQLRWSPTRAGLDQAKWHGPEGVGTHYESPGAAIPRIDPDARYLQYKADFISPYGCGSPRLSEVRIELNVRPKT